MAVALHLYYPELWEPLTAYLDRLGDRVDLFVTLSREHHRMADVIKARYPGTRCVVVPNRGRDVLPFDLVGPALLRLGYAGVLKIHAKRSVQFEAGDTWRDTMLEQLVPAGAETIDSLLEVLRRADTGLVGPRGTYFPLSTYWANNATTVRRLVGPYVSQDRLALLDDPERLGFFAGTMFWARLDAIAPLLRQPTRSFVREPTPRDGTVAHALERAFSVLPELQGRRLFDSDGQVVQPRASSAEPLPDWYLKSVQRAWRREQTKGA